MVTLHQLRVSWTGMKGGPGVSTFYSQTDKDVTLAHLHTFFDAIKYALPTSVTIKFPTVGSEIDSATGNVTGTWSSSLQPNVVGTDNGRYSAPSGAVINWHTGLYVGGRELRGKTFLVPCGSGVFESDGSLNNDWVRDFQLAAAGLCGPDDPIVIWSPLQGATAPAVAGTVPDKSVVLRSRRD